METSSTTVFLARVDFLTSSPISRIFTLVIGQIMSQLVKKSVSMTYFPLSDPKVNVFPEASESLVLDTTAGIGTSNIVPPALAAVPEIGGGVVEGIVMAA